MIAVVNQSATEDQLAHFISWIENRGFRTNVSKGENETIVGIIGDTTKIDPFLLESMDIIDRVQRVSEPYKKANRKFHPQNSVIDCGFGVKIGDGSFQVMAGPNALDGRDLDALATQAKSAGARLLMAGTYNAKTSPYSFSGLRPESLSELCSVAHVHEMPAVAEIMDPRDVETFVSSGVNVIQVGARSMQNFPLLKELGRTDVPILIKRGLEATVDEWLMAAEYVMSEGNEQVILCERGIRTAETRYRHTLDISSIIAVHGLSHLPVICDPSRAAGLARFVPGLSLAACAAGADGLTIEIDDQPMEESLADGGRALTPEQFAQMMERIAKLRAALAEDRS